jgi:hypothetical protein
MSGDATYRTRLDLRLAVTAAAVLWAAALTVLVQNLEQVQPRVLLGAAGFLAFFAVFSAYYGRLGVTVKPEGIVVSRFFGAVPVRYEEIVRIEVQQGFAGTLYQVRTRRGPVQFTSVLARHRELFDLLRQRAGLDRLG